jgi:hypothetical protein
LEPNREDKRDAPLDPVAELARLDAQVTLDREALRAFDRADEELEETADLLAGAKQALRRQAHDGTRTLLAEGMDPVDVRIRVTHELLGDDGDDTPLEALMDDVEDAIAGRPFDESRR